MTKYKTIFKNEGEMHETSVQEINKKRCLKTDAQKSKNISKMIPKSVQSEVISGVAPLVAVLVARNAFGHQKWPPALPKCFQ